MSSWLNTTIKNIFYFLSQPPVVSKQHDQQQKWLIENETEGPSKNLFYWSSPFESASITSP